MLVKIKFCLLKDERQVYNMNIIIKKITVLVWSLFAKNKRDNNNDVRCVRPLRRQNIEQTNNKVCSLRTLRNLFKNDTMKYNPFLLYIKGFCSEEHVFKIHFPRTTWMIFFWPSYIILYLTFRINNGHMLCARMQWWHVHIIIYAHICQV